MATAAALEARHATDDLPDLSLAVVPTGVDSHSVGIEIYDDAARVLTYVVLTREAAQRVARELVG